MTAATTYRIHDSYGVASATEYRSLAAAQRDARRADREVRANGCPSQAPHSILIYRDGERTGESAERS